MPAFQWYLRSIQPRFPQEFHPHQIKLTNWLQLKDRYVYLKKKIFFQLQNMKFLFWCAFEHLEFRIPEFEALAKLLKIELHWVDKNQTHPWVILDLKSSEEACKLCSRSISTKFCAQLWVQSENYDKLHQQIRNYLSDNGLKYGPEISFKIHIETIFKKLNIEERLAKIETFSYMDCQGQVKLTNPDVTFAAFEFYGFDQNNLAEEPLNLFFGTLISEGQRELISKLSLKKRLFIGNVQFVFTSWQFCTLDGVLIIASKDFTFKKKFVKLCLHSIYKL